MSTVVVDIGPRIVYAGCRDVVVAHHAEQRIDYGWQGSARFRFWVICVHDAEAYERDAGPLSDWQRGNLYDPAMVGARERRCGARQPALFDS